MAQFIGFHLSYDLWYNNITNNETVKNHGAFGSTQAGSEGFRQVRHENFASLSEKDGSEVEDRTTAQ